MVDDDVEGRTEAELRWHCLCLCRQISHASSIVGLLRQFPGGLCPENQAWFIEHCINDPLAAYFPRCVDFERKLIRAVVLAVESDGYELADELMAAFSRVLTNTGANSLNMVNPTNSTSQWSYKLCAYSADNVEVDTKVKATLEMVKKGDSAILHSNLVEAVAVADSNTAADADAVLPATTTGDERCGLLALHTSNNMLAGETGCWDWEAGFFLSEFIFNHPQIFKNKRILELGSGCGMAGVALSRVSARSILCTDGDKETLHNCLQNLRVNGLEVTEISADVIEPANSNVPCISVQRLRWEDGAASLPIESIDVIVGADLTYDPVNIPPLIKVLKEILLSSKKHLDGAVAALSTAAVSEPLPVASPASSIHTVEAYIVTTRRSEATFQKFLDALDGEPELQVEDITSKKENEAELSRGSSGGSVGFCHVESLEAARERIVLHRITLKNLS